MILKRCILLASIFLYATSQAVDTESNDLADEAQSKLSVIRKDCPNYQYQCPDCPEGTKCVYPNSGGCEGAGVPVCKPTNCNIRCLTRQLPCPESCPFSCEYSGPPCCPFMGQPTCGPVCQTFVRCAMTPCPADCPDDCFYPDAGHCCPYSGKAICNKDRLTLSSSTPQIDPPTPTVEEPTEEVTEEPTVTETPDHHKHKHKHYHHGYGHNHHYYPGNGYDNGFYHDYSYSYEDNGYGYGYGPIDPPGNSGYGYGHGSGHGHGYKHENNEPAPEQPHLEKRYYVDNYNNYGRDNYPYNYRPPVPVYHRHIDNNDGENCPTCPKTVTDVSVEVEFVTKTRDPGAIVCAQFIIPCPEECPDSCIYPTNSPCPYTHQPWCPSPAGHRPPPTNQEECDYVYKTEGYPFPYFPKTDPYYSSFTSMLNHSGVTSTPAIVSEDPTTTPTVFCPLIFFPCPEECPDTCLRHDGPCPYAKAGYCPGSKPTETEKTVTTPSPTTSKGHVVCPHYMLGCPVCPSGYSCSRETTGDCPNTNVPFCASTLAPGAQPTGNGVLFEYYPYMYPPPPPRPWYGGGGGYRKPGWNHKFYEMGLVQEDTFSDNSIQEDSFSENSIQEDTFSVNPNQEEPIMEDLCSMNGFTKIASKNILDRIQDMQTDCQGCQSIEWDETCEHFCVYRTQENCCLQSKCL